MAFACPTCGTPVVTAGGATYCPACLLSAGLGAPPAAPIDDAPQSIADELATGVTVGPYRIRERLGVGGMSEVYLAAQEHPIRRLVALKVLKADPIDRQAAARFNAERQALAILNHPGIAKVFDAGFTEDGRPYLAMEYIRGAWLTRFADESALGIVERLELFARVCDAVHHAHQKGIIHRDLKPSNIIAAWDDGRIVVKVIDFGIARVLGPKLIDESVCTEFGVVLGTPEYMSPEQAGLARVEVDARADIYALGLLLYELLTGSLPFDRERLRREALLEMLRVIREEEPPRLSTRVQTLGDRAGAVAGQRRVDPRSLIRRLRGELEWIVAHALEKNPAHRYASASELAADVRRHLADEPVNVGPPSTMYRLRKAMRRHRALAAASVAVLVSLLVGGLVALTQWRRAEQARVEGRRQLVASMVTTGIQLAENDDTAGGLVWLAQALGLEEDENKVAAHRARIAHMFALLPRLVRLWPHESSIAALALSERGEVATGTSGGVIRLWSVEHGGPIGAPFTRATGIVSLAFSPDGHRLAASSLDGSVLMWVLATRRVEIDARHGAGTARAVFSPNGTSLVTAGADGVLRVWQVPGGRLVTELQARGPIGQIVFDRDGRFVSAGVLLQGFRLFDLQAPRREGRFIPCASTRAEDRPAFVAGGMIAAPCGAVQLRGVASDARTDTTLPGDQPAQHVLASRTGARFVVSGNEASARLYAGATGARPILLLTKSIAQLSRFSADDELVVVCGTGGDVHVWTSGGERAAPVLSVGGSCIDAQFTRADRLLVTASSDGFVRVWDLSAMERPLPFLDVGEFVSQAVFSPRGDRLATGSGQSVGTGFARVWSVRTGAPVTPPMDAAGRAWSVVFAPFSPTIAIGAAEYQGGSARLWNVETGEPVGDADSRGAVRWQAFSPNGTLVASAFDRSDAGLPGFVQVRRAASAAPLYGPLEVPGLPMAVSISPDNRKLLTAGTDPRIALQVWDLRSGRRLAARAHTDGVRAAFFMGSSRLYAIGGDRRGQLWTADLEPMDTRVTYGGSVLEAEPGPDERRVAASTEAGEIRLHDLRWPGHPLGVMRHRGLVYENKFSADGRWIVTAGFDQTSRVWDAWTGAAITPAMTTRGLVWHAMFAPDSKAWAYAGADVFLEPLRSDPRPFAQLVLIAEIHAGRSIGAGGQEVPLGPDELLERWRRRDPSAPALGPAPTHWLRARAQQASLGGRWATTIDILHDLRQRGPLFWVDHMRLLNAYGALGRWEEARTLIRQLGVSIDAAPELAHLEAIASAQLGDRNRVAEVCRTLVERFAETRNPDRAAAAVRVCVLAPEGVALEWDRVVSLARRAPLRSRELLRRGGLIGAALVRAGQGRVAMPYFRDAASASAGFVNPHTLVFASKAARQLGDQQGAAAWRTRLLDTLSESGPWRARIRRAPLGAWDAAEIEVLRRISQ